MQHTQSGFDLRHFVEMNFILPKEGEIYVPGGPEPARTHRRSVACSGPHHRQSEQMGLPPASAKTLCRAGTLPAKFYYWDSYFTMLGLAESGHWDEIGDMVDNFAYELDTRGHIPNGNRTYYLSCSQPPFFSLMVELLATHDKATR